MGERFRQQLSFVGQVPRSSANFLSEGFWRLEPDGSVRPEIPAPGAPLEGERSGFNIFRVEAPGQPPFFFHDRPVIDPNDPLSYRHFGQEASCDWVLVDVRGSRAMGPCFGGQWFRTAEPLVAPVEITVSSAGYRSEVLTIPSISAPRFSVVRVVFADVDLWPRGAPPVYVQIDSEAGQDARAVEVPGTALFGNFLGGTATMQVFDLPAACELVGDGVEVRDAFDGGLVYELPLSLAPGQVVTAQPSVVCS